MSEEIVRRKRSVADDDTATADAAEDAADALDREDEEELYIPINISPDNILSTGSTLLDLAISGKRIRGGGVPGGILVELYGPSGSGKTGVLASIGASAQARGGEVDFADPEARLDIEYSRITGLTIDEKHYSRPDTVTELMKMINDREYKRSDVVNVFCGDSLAALSTELEMEKGDKMGMRRAKEFSEGLRKLARWIARDNRLLVCSNQIRQGDFGETTPGGQAIPFYASLRVRVAQKSKIEKERKTEGGAAVSKVIGIMSECFTRKNSIDDPFRTVPIYIIFGYGIDDVRANLQYLKDMRKDSVYTCPDGKTYKNMDQAIKWIESNDFEADLREEVIDMWERVEALFAQDRKPKKRF